MEKIAYLTPVLSWKMGAELVENKKSSNELATELNNINEMPQRNFSKQMNQIIF